LFYLFPEAVLEAIHEPCAPIQFCIGLCYTVFNEFCLSEDRPLLSRMYVRRVRVFWHEEIAQLES